MNYIDPAVIMALMLIVGLLYTIYDGVKSAAKPAPKPYEPAPFCDRHLQPDEIAYLLKHLSIYDAVSPIDPDDYHNGTKYELEGHISKDLGRPFKITQRSWFNIARAWYVTRGQPQSERVERLDVRLKLNI